MTNPFYYPKVKHRRTRTPPVYSNYRRYKSELRLEFSGQCVYCRAVDTIKGLESFGVDHYRPQKHFPNLATEYLNLFYACNRCNSLKRDVWPSPERVRDGQYVPNPCEHVMFDYLRYRGGSVTAASNAGAWTIDLLDLNDPQVVLFREGLIGVLHQLTSAITVSMQTITEANKKLASASTPEEKGRTATELGRAQINLKELQDIAKKLLGSD